MSNFQENINIIYRGGKIIIYAEKPQMWVKPRQFYSVLWILCYLYSLKYGEV